MGGLIAQALALAEPRRCLSLSLLCTFALILSAAFGRKVLPGGNGRSTDSDEDEED